MVAGQLQVLPVNAHQCLIRLLGVPNLLRDAVLVPELLDLPESFFAQMQGIPPSESLVSLPIVIKVRRRIKTAFGFAS